MITNIKLIGTMIITVAMLTSLTSFVTNIQPYQSANALDIEELHIACILNSCNEDNSVSNTNIDDDSINCSAEQGSGGGDNSTTVVANVCGVNLPTDSSSTETISPPISLPL
ncbi:hypothetical protein [Candidatus Nitrosocosmicus hydrocola]|uniref:hypothetical protein n=1 Tax=Candidatus Nitrosocosmicus hydrocola TaxID=1826872 RepID=UPI0011E58D68|nr:hypothetical protein [Candidatus Nitrosocosmicus hydrocola]